jgi:hypothetical protein
LSDVIEAAAKGGDEIEGNVFPEATGNPPVSSGSKAYLTEGEKEVNSL